MFKCDIAHRRSVASLCMQYKTRYNPKQPLYGALSVPYVPVRVTLGALVAHWYTYEPPRCSTSQYRSTFNPLSVSLWNDYTPFDGVRLSGTKSRANDYLLALIARSVFVFYCFPFSFFSL